MKYSRALTPPRSSASDPPRFGMLVPNGGGFANRWFASARTSMLSARARSRSPQGGRPRRLTLAWAVMDLVIAGGHGLGLTLPERHQIAALIAARSVPQMEERIA